MTAENDDNLRQIERQLPESPPTTEPEADDAEQIRIRILYEEQLRRMQCRGGSCGDELFLG